MTDTKYAVAPMSMAHTFGNVTAFEVEFIKNLFPKKFFQTVNIASNIAFRQFNVLDNTNRDFIKKQKPMLIVRPRIDAMDSEIFLSGTFLTQRITDNFGDLDVGNLQPFMSDPSKEFTMKYLLNRVRMYFDVTLVFETQMEQINQFMYLKNRVRQDFPFYINTALESNIPKSIMHLIADTAGIDFTDSKTLLDYVNNKSCYPITYKLKNSTGKDEYFRYYPAQIDTTFTNLSMDDGSKRGFVSDAYAINLTIQTEFYTSGLYYFFTKKNEIIEAFDMSITADSGSSITPIFTVSNLFNITPPEGWNLYATPMFKVEYNGQPDTLDFNALVNSSINSAIKYHIDNNIPLTPLIKIFVLKDNEKLDEAAGDFSVDYNTMTLTVNNTNKTSTYRMIIYTNTLYINNLVSTIYNISEEK